MSLSKCKDTKNNCGFQGFPPRRNVNICEFNICLCQMGNLWGMYGESQKGFPTSQSLCTSAFREICGEPPKLCIFLIF